MLCHEGHRGADDDRQSEAGEASVPEVSEQERVGHADGEEGVGKRDQQRVDE